MRKLWKNAFTPEKIKRDYGLCHKAHENKICELKRVIKLLKPNP